MSDSYAVHLDSLVDFARELNDDFDLLLRVEQLLDALGAGSGDLAALGDFPEGHLLMQRHRSAIADVHVLVQEVRDVVAFGHDVTVEVAEQYAGEDRAVADSLHTLAGRLDAGGYA